MEAVIRALNTGKREQIVTVNEFCGYATLGMKDGYLCGWILHRVSERKKSMSKLREK